MDSHPIMTTARELQPLILQYLEEGERCARLAPEVVRAAGEAGLFRLFAPREVIQRACGDAPTEAPLLDYLEAKFGTIYSL